MARARARAWSLGRTSTPLPPPWLNRKLEHLHNLESLVTPNVAPRAVRPPPGRPPCTPRSCTSRCEGRTWRCEHPFPANASRGPEAVFDHFDGNMRREHTINRLNCKTSGEERWKQYSNITTWGKRNNSIYDRGIL